MPIIVNLHIMLARRRVSVKKLSAIIGLSSVNLGILKNGKAKAVRIETLDKICTALRCQPADLLEHVSPEVYQRYLNKEF